MKTTIKTIIFAVLIGVLVVTFLPSIKGISDELPNPISEESSFDLVRPGYEKLNEYRRSHGLSELDRNRNLETSALASAEAIHSGERGWNHDGYVASISATYKDWSLIGENIARNFSKFDTVMVAWHESEKHRDILQLARLHDAGIGNYRNVWVLHVGRPK